MVDTLANGTGIREFSFERLADEGRRLYRSRSPESFSRSNFIIACLRISEIREFSKAEEMKRTERSARNLLASFQPCFKPIGSGSRARASPKKLR